MEGGLFARAVSAGSKAHASGSQVLDDGHFAESACLNCGIALHGSHCHECGQAAHLHRTLGAFLHDLLHGALHFEGRTWKTLPKLAVKPGELTRRYIDGERRKFVSPMALFLFTIFLMFAVFQITGISTPTDIDDSAASAKLQAERAIEQIELESQARDVDEAERETARAEIAELRQAIEDIEAGRNFSFTNIEGRRVHMTTNLTGIDVIDHGIVAKWRKNPGLMLYKLQTNFYKFSWMLIPLSIPFVWLLFAWKRDFKAYDHAIFVTYSLSFMTLLILTLTLLGMAGLSAGMIVFASTLIPAIHIYKQLRGAYGLSRFSAFWRLCVLTVFIAIILTLFLQLLLVIGSF
ncbi:MAG: DUF3667 domain-containing protein [Erythrobacter sp.]|nr:DUF3667 domain-containing protein [Erythrobacter sp.]